MNKNKYILIDRDKCIGCGSCVVASDGLCDFIDGRAWAENKPFDNPQDLIDICPVEAISAVSVEIYEEAKKKNNI